MKIARLLAALLMGCAAAPAIAGPPYLTDDPVPTETGHFEIYAFATGEHSHSADDSELDADAGLDFNYGAVKGVQISATVPMSFSHDALSGWRTGTGDVELGVKYRFFNDEKSGVAMAVFPRTILPTSGLGTHEKTRFLMPLWIEKDFSHGTSLFGGGGFEFNPGMGNRNFVQAAVALTQELSKTLTVGGEITWQQPQNIGGTNQTRVGLGAIVKLTDHYALLFSGGPTWGKHQTGYHFYTALGLDF